MSDRTYNVLFLCTGNSARSILAEAYLNELGRGRFRAYSAGSQPTGTVNPIALELLTRNRIPVAGARSKAWEEFAKPDAPRMDFIITVCDKASGETCPVWPGRPITAHWGVEDPAAVIGDYDIQCSAFMKSFVVLQKRIALLVSLPLRSIDAMATEQQLRLIGKER